MAQYANHCLFVEVQMLTDNFLALEALQDELQLALVAALLRQDFQQLLVGQRNGLAGGPIGQRQEKAPKVRLLEACDARGLANNSLNIESFESDEAVSL